MLWTHSLVAEGGREGGRGGKEGGREGGREEEREGGKRVLKRDTVQTGMHMH